MPLLLAPSGPRSDGPAFVQRFAHDLAATSGLGCSAVVLVDPVAAFERPVVTVGPPPGLLDTADLVDLVVATEPVVVVASRTHAHGLRELAAAWGTERLLVAPCIFGHELLAIGIAPFAAADLGASTRAASVSAERTAAGLMRALLFSDRILEPVA